MASSSFRPHMDRICISLALSFATLAGAATPALGQTAITPADRVSSRLNVREEATTDSPVVGKLEKNETADLLDDSVSHWYKIRLHNGVEGFVSKSWSRRVAAPTVAEQRIRLGGWNLKKLGHGTTKDFPRVANVIESNFDVVAIVEVMQKEQAHAGYDQLLQELGSSWAGLLTDSPRPNTTSGNSEFYAILYRPSRLQPCAGWATLRYHADNDGSGTGTSADHFAREPAFGCFKATSSGGTEGFDFVLAAYHATFKGGVTAIKSEVDHVDDVFPSMAAAVPGEQDLLIVGDFNLTPAQLATVVTTAADRTTGTGSTLNQSGGVTGNLYDHLLVQDESATTELVGNARVLDVRHVATTNEVFFQTVSDHLPIMVEVRSSGPDDD